MQQHVLDRIDKAKIEYPEHIGVKLGIAVSKSRISLPVICEYLEVSTNTLYRWFYGGNVPTQSIASRVESVLKAIENGLEAGTLPSERKVRYSDLVGIIHKTNE